MKQIYDYLTKEITVVNRKMQHINNFFNNYQKDSEFRIRADKLIKKADL
jgi:hypothetical protein